MIAYYRVIQSAFLNFPLIAALITLPFLLWHYKKYGAVPLLRTAVVYSFVLYCMTAYYLAVLPLPPVESVAQMTSATYSLVPWAGVWSFLQQNALDFHTVDAWWKLLTSGTVREMFFNVCMFVPFGVYLRYYFKRRWWQALLIGFAGTLFLELTQLSGLYGFYPRPYRLFDVNDLLHNTFGTLLGFWFTPLICFFLPSREKLDAQAYRKGEGVPMFRRLFAFGIDWFLVLCGVGLCGVLVLRLWQQLHSIRTVVVLAYLGGFVYFVILQWLCGGRTIGKSAVRLRTTRIDSGKPHFWQLLVHFCLLYFILAPSPLYLLYFLRNMANYPNEIPSYAGIAGALFFGSIFVLFCIETLMKLMGSKTEFFFGRICRTSIISTIVPPPEISEKNDAEAVPEILHVWQDKTEPAEEAFAPDEIDTMPCETAAPTMFSQQWENFVQTPQIAKPVLDTPDTTGAIQDAPCLPFAPSQAIFYDTPREAANAPAPPLYHTERMVQPNTMQETPVPPVM